MAIPLIPAAVGILSRLAPVARNVYQGVKASRAVNNPVTRGTMKAVGYPVKGVVTTLQNPTVSALGTPLAASDAVRNVGEIRQNIADENYDLALGNLGLTALEIAGLPYLLRRGTKSNLFRGKIPFTRVGKGELPTAKGAAVTQKKLAGKFGKGIGEGKFTKTKAGLIGSSLVGGYGSEAGLFDDLISPASAATPTITEEKQNQETQEQGQGQGQVNLNLSDSNFADDISQQMGETEDLVKLATKGKTENVVNQDLITRAGANQNNQQNRQQNNQEGNIGDVDMSGFTETKGGQKGDAGFAGFMGSNAGEIVTNSTNTNLTKNRMILNLMQSQKLMLPGQFARIEEQIQKNFQNSSDRLEEYRKTLLDQERKTFDEFVSDFKQRSGMEGYNKKQQDYILLKLGLDLMSGKSYEGGVSGFLDILGSAGANAVESLSALQASESELMQGMALKYDEYLNTLDQQLTQNEKYLFEADLGIMQQRDNGMLDLFKSKVEASMRIDEKYMEALMKQINESGEGDYELYEKTFGVKVLNPDAYLGQEYRRGSRDKGSNQLYIIPRKGKAVTADSLGIADENTYEFKQTAIDKAFNQIHYASDGQHLINLFFATVSQGNLMPGADANVADIASNLVGIEQFIRTITGDIITRAGTAGSTDKTSLLVDKLENNTDDIVKISKLNNSNIEKIIMENAALSDPDEENTQQYMLNDYKKAINEAQKYGDLAIPKGFKGEKKGNTWAEHMFNTLISAKEQEKMSETQKAEKREEIKKALARYKVIETNLTYIVANANKAEDRLTQRDIEEAKKLTEAIVNMDPKVIMEKYRLLETRLNRNFEKNAKVLLSSISETPESLFSQFGHMKSIRNYQAQQALKAKGEEIKDLSEMSNFELLQIFNQGQ
tara:strand:+ start:1926 stop:4598 length:2673 start_codon:yes stop_codon:yes gene_type:complete